MVTDSEISSDSPSGRSGARGKQNAQENMWETDKILENKAVVLTVKQNYVPRVL
jgi:hypothetical protein